MSLWLVVFLMGELGVLLMPLVAMRTLASFAQTGLNIRLGRRIPVERQTKLDWWLVAGIFAGGEVAAVMANASGNMHSPLLYLPMLLPFTVLQFRMTSRAFAAYETELASRVVAFRLERVVQRAAA